jgi:hypothetical protein
MTAAEIYESVTNGGVSDFAAVIAIRQRHGPWCLIGVQGKVWAWEDAQRRPSKRKKDELDLIRLGEAYPELRVEMPRAIVAQLEGDTK